MALLTGTIETIEFQIKAVTKYKLVFIPFATYTTMGDASLLSVFGILVYGKIGNVRSLFGYTWGNNEEHESI